MNKFDGAVLNIKIIGDSIEEIEDFCKAIEETARYDLLRTSRMVANNPRRGEMDGFHAYVTILRVG